MAGRTRSRIPSSAPSNSQTVVKGEGRVKRERQPGDKGKEPIRDEEKSEEEDAYGEPDDEMPHQGEGLGEDEDAQGDDDDDDDDGGVEDGSSPRGRKRARLNDRGESHPGSKPDIQTHVATLPRDTDG